MNDITTTTDTVSTKIYTIRGLQVMLDRDLAVLLNPTVQKNLIVQE